MKSILLSTLLLILFMNTRAQDKPVDEQLVDYYQTQRYADALELLKSTYHEPVTDQKVLSSMAYASQMAGLLADAETYYQRVYDLDSANYRVLFSLGNLNLRKGNNQKAKGYFLRLLQKDSSNFILYKDLAQISIDESDSVKIMTCLEKANQLQPKDADVAGQLSGFYIGAKKYPAAEKVLDTAINADPQNIFLLQSLVKLEYAQRKWKDVIATGESLFQAGDNSPYVQNKVGEAYYFNKQYVCGIETLSAIQGIYKTEGTFYFIASCYKGLKDQAKAIEFFNRAIEAGLSPNISSYYDEIADSYTTLKKNRSALQAYQKSLQFEESPLTYYLIAGLYDTGLKNKKSALRYYRKYIASKPPEKQKKYVDYSKSRIEALSH
ncbi:tetratricopeptide repeat protein [Mucilaginibacter ginsenosidivorans]|uniref:Tetratricopeptide repeat protein n=1 Tax=Mucilaginibacter ginsenosidivorans TaxID=398053 RepID=A0A5B8V094_9SPHI|nr:tetratricopeptide repeat protein [Mucilaginibacter ginsenosidivorans]QEC63956.1 tetratricopeptide repeat protein [Mucilaginibacter ginsenosidivorans]